MGGHSTFQFTKIVEKMSRGESKINASLKAFGNDMMAPITAHFNQITKKRKRSMVGQLAGRVKKKATVLSTSMKNSHFDNTNSVSNSKDTFISMNFKFWYPKHKINIHLGIKRLDTIANDSTTNISRHRVSFNMNQLDKKGENDQHVLANLSSIMPKKMSNTSGSKVLTLRLLK